MLCELYIENVAVIEKSNIIFSKGLNVLTGETGAGKSIVIDSIGAVLGFRTSRELIRTGAEKAVVTARFTDIGDRAFSFIKSMGIDCVDRELIINREIISNGKNNCRINGFPVTVSMLKQIGKFLINIHGQHESYELMSPDLHIRYIDDLGDHHGLLKEYGEAFKEYKETEAKLNKSKSLSKERSRRIDILSFQIEELENADIKVGEYQSLCEKRSQLANSEKIRDALMSAIYLLGEEHTDGQNALDLLEDALRGILGACKYHEGVNSLSERLNNAVFEIRDILSESENLLRDLDADPQLLYSIEERVDLLNSLFKKYGDNEEQLVEFLADAKEELDTLINYEEHFEKLTQDCEAALKRAYAISAQLSAKRKAVAEEFSKSVSEQMHYLDMPNALIEVDIKECELYDLGCDSVEFLISANVGEPVKPVAKIASGGELSRMMLSIKTVLSQHDPTDTLIFDEVDSGVSGSAAERIGLKLKQVSSGSQVLCVTHLPQIAAVADSHYKISKNVINSRTYTCVDLLSENGRVEELSRIIGGVTIAESAKDYARELLKKYKG